MLHNTGMKGLSPAEPGTPTVLRWARLAPGGGGGGQPAPRWARGGETDEGGGGGRQADGGVAEGWVGIVSG